MKDVILGIILLVVGMTAIIHHAGAQHSQMVQSKPLTVNVQRVHDTNPQITQVRDQNGVPIYTCTQVKNVVPNGLYKPGEYVCLDRQGRFIVPSRAE